MICSLVRIMYIKGAIHEVVLISKYSLYTHMSVHVSVF